MAAHVVVASITKSAGVLCHDGFSWTLVVLRFLFLGHQIT
jgi:hypothetical protein